MHDNGCPLLLLSLFAPPLFILIRPFMIMSTPFPLVHTTTAMQDISTPLLLVGMRGSIIIRLRPCTTMSTPPPHAVSINLVERGLVIAYRVLRHQTESRGASRHPTDAFVSSENGGTPSTYKHWGAINDSLSSRPVLMVMVPGLFQTLDTLESAVLPLLQAHPQLTILLVAPPGLPNTHWPAKISLNGEV